MPTIILIQGFCLLKTEITRFPVGFRFKHFLRFTDSLTFACNT